jgi:hypothetical protein
MVGKRQEPIRILPPIIEPLSEADFEEVTDLLADLIREKLQGKRTRSEDTPTASG